ncbi:MAG: Fic family protein [Candidatus Liptonbacteria bacterium]|nr:Fic family protein [Candidatus Liptonbacteria bacterium]MBI3114345.1 Fic family protein [Candidatus Harrisonbacteria bacterium]
MVTPNPRQHNIIAILLEKNFVRSSDIHTELLRRGDRVSLVTVKRALSEMASRGTVRTSGAGRTTAYAATAKGRLFANIDAKNYCAVEPDKRFGARHYNFELFEAIEPGIFSADEQERLATSTAAYRARTKNLPPAVQEKETERFIIELSWKSSKIEGNTYSLLDTEKLIVRGVEAPGHDKNEARMILNHKEAFKFVQEHAAHYAELTKANMEEIHKILVHHMNVRTGVRAAPVGVTGSTYTPLNNPHQIAEAVAALARASARLATPYEKALAALLGISYVQPFEDGNKRTARMMANAILLAHACAPLSYRNVDESEYREAMFVFYEVNSLVPFKKIFVNQYEFAAANYAVA